MADTIATYNTNVKQGATYNKVITWLTDNVPVDLTGATAIMKVKTSKCDDTCAEEIISLTTENGRITLGGVLGTITLLITAADTLTLPCGQFYYDLYINFGTTSYCKLIGTFTVEGSISK
jgi:hypothetical protein